MITILFSTPQEASVFLKTYQNGRFDGIQEGEIQQDRQIRIGITGVGKIKATLRTEQIIRASKPSRILHIGTATKLNPKTNHLSLIGIEQVFEGDRMELTVPLYPRMPLEMPFKKMDTGTLVTQDHILKENKERVYWERLADVCDMEGYAIAYVSGLHGIPCHIVKVVLGEMKNTETEYKQTLKQAYQAISDFLLHVPNLSLLQLQPQG